MAQTYTSPTLSVTDGEITSHDTDTVAEDIRILSAECRWQGVDVTETITKTDTTTNTVTELIESRTTFSASMEVPEPGQGSFDETYAYVGTPSSDPSSFDAEWRIIDESTGTTVHGPFTQSDASDVVTWIADETTTDYSASQYESLSSDEQHRLGSRVRDDDAN